MKKFFLVLTSIATLSTTRSVAQETRPMTQKEVDFYESSIKLLQTSIPTSGFNFWTPTYKNSDDFYKEIAAFREPNKGPYDYTFEIVFSLPPEKLQPTLDSLFKQFEGITDEKLLQEYAKKLHTLTNNSELRLRVYINFEHVAMQDCIGKVNYRKILDKDSGWGIDLLNIAEVEGSDDFTSSCKDAILVGIGKVSPFKHFKYDNGVGGNVVSATKLLSENGESAFKIYNIFLHIEGPRSESHPLLSLIDWKKLQSALSSAN
jgi:hypothetical protein